MTTPISDADGIIYGIPSVVSQPPQCHRTPIAPPPSPCPLPPLQVRSVACGGLPLKVLLPLSERVVVGGGWDGLLRVFTCGRGGGGRWELTQVLGEPGAGVWRGTCDALLGQ